MELRTLRAFVEVVNRGGFSRASKTLHATQSTVSKAVRQLEDEFGTPLLDRGPTSNQLTGAGEIVLRHATAVLAECDDLVRELDELRWLKRGTLRLGIPAFSSGAIIAPVLSAYRAKYPAIGVEITEDNTPRLQDLLRAGTLDLAALAIPPGADFDFEEQDIQALAIVALVPKENPLSKATEVQLIDLIQLPFLLLPEDSLTSSLILGAVSALGATPKIAARSGQLDLLAMLVEDGAGVAFVPDWAVPLIVGRAVRPLRLAAPSIVGRLVFAWRKNGYLSHAARAWLALSREVQAQVKPET